MEGYDVFNLDWKKRGRGLPANWSETIFVDGFGVSGDPTAYWEGSEITIRLNAAIYKRRLPGILKGDLIDLGCGTAPLLNHYRSEVDSYCLVDWPSSLHENSSIDHCADLNEPLDIPDDTFDVALVTSVLEHIKSPKLLINEIYRIMKPEGALFLQVPFAYSVHEAPWDYFRYTEFGLIELIEAAGFKIESLDSVGNRDYLLADLLNRRLCRGGVFSFVAKLFREPICRSFERKWKPGKNEDFPLGYVVVARKLTGK